MNIYVVTEGNESAVYKSWIPYVNPCLRFIDYIDDVGQNCVFIISGEGYPGYFGMIDSAIEDISHYGQFDRLVIAVDSEDMTRAEKHAEVSNYVNGRQCSAQVRIVIQHFCFETWALGNRAAIPRNPSAGKLLEYKRLFDVTTRDPELLPDKPDEDLNRSQFAERYLRRGLNARHRNMTYTKRNPQALLHPAYFGQVKSRFVDTGHINSFNDFLTAFV